MRKRSVYCREAALRGDSACHLVYAAFDDASTLPELQESAKKFGFTLAYDEDAPKLGRPLNLVGGSISDEQKVNEVINSVKNMVAFVEAFYLIGADMSFYFKFARALRGLDLGDMGGVSLMDNINYQPWNQGL